MIYILHSPEWRPTKVMAVLEGPDGYDLEIDARSWSEDVIGYRPTITTHSQINTPEYRAQVEKLREWQEKKKEKCGLLVYLDHLKELGFKVLEFKEADPYPVQ